jgi:hypothetical protein
MDGEELGRCLSFLDSEPQKKDKMMMKDINSTAKTSNFTKQLGVTLLVAKRLKGQNMGHGSHTFSDT